jgi:hypothetical protein
MNGELYEPDKARRQERAPSVLAATTAPAKRAPNGEEWLEILLDIIAHFNRKHELLENDHKCDGDVFWRHRNPWSESPSC